MTKTMTLPPISESATPGAEDAMFGPDQASRARRERWIGMAVSASASGCVLAGGSS